jgi:hypothetical protein
MLLSMPHSFFPLTVLYDDRKRRRRIEHDNVESLSEVLLFARKRPDGVTYGEIELEKKGHPDFWVYAQWSQPRWGGFNSVTGDVPLDIDGIDKEVTGSLVNWALDVANGPLEFAYGNIELSEEHSAKLAKKQPSPGADLAKWLESPPPSPKAPPDAITDVVWMNILGKPYVDLIGRDHLLASPVHKVIKLPGGAIALQVSESPFDYGTKAYADQCEAAKNHIGREFFFDWDNPDRAYPQPMLKVEYARPRRLSATELEQPRKRAGIPKPVEPSDSEDKVWLEGLRDWVDNNEDYAKRFVRLVGDKRDALDYSVDSLKVLDKYMLKLRKRDREADVDLVLMASAYLTQVLIRNSLPGGKATLRVEAENGHAVVELPNEMIAVPMARIANLWNLGKEEETHFYARTLLRR